MKADKDHIQKQKSEKNKSSKRWISIIFPLTVLISAIISFLSSIIFEHAGIIPACLVLLLIVLIGIIFDIIGVAVTAADVRPFHSMASHREKGAREALSMIRHADRVSSFCNDVVGDICGVVSGVASASLVALIVVKVSVGGTLLDYLQILMAALVSGLTVGGKAIGKTIAMNQSTRIVHAAGLVVYYTKNIPGILIGKLRRRK